MHINLTTFGEKYLWRDWIHNSLCMKHNTIYAVWGGRREEGSGWGTRVYLWQIHVDIWQNQYNIEKLKNKKNKIKF